MTGRSRRAWAGVAIAVALSLVGAAGTVPAFAAAGPATGQVSDQPGFAQGRVPAAAVPASERLRLTVALKARDQAGLEALVTQVSTPGSSAYGQYLSAQVFHDRFSPTSATVGAVSGYLASHGLRVTGVSDNRLFLTVEGTAAQVQEAFDTQLGVYDVKGQLRRAPQRPGTVPSAIAGSIQAVTGLTGAALMRPSSAGREGASAAAHPAAAPNVVPPPDGFRNAPPCSTFWGAALDTTDPAVGNGYPSPLPYAPCGYVPSQLRGAYGINGLVRSGLNGRGVTVAITDAFGSPLMAQDADQYSRNRGEPQFRAGQLQQIVFPADPVLEQPDQCDAAGWYGEENLDVEAVHGMAPGANVLYVGASSCTDDALLQALNTIVDGRQADMITNSWGDNGEDVTPDVKRAYTLVFLQAAVEGIGVYFSSGDNGDEIETIGSRETDFPASHPLVTAVGGTSLAVGRGDENLFETGWGTTRVRLVDGAYTPAPPGVFLYGSGGGTSQQFGEPVYQLGVVPSAISRFFGGAPGRAVPDISTVGDPNTGMLIGITQTFPEGVRYDEYRIGGTSLSSPLMAGIMAIADQARGFHHGFANPAIYGLARRHSSALRDVVDPAGTVADVRVDFLNGVDAADGTITSVRTMNQTGTLHTRRGYDDVTGVGTPRGERFVFDLGFLF